MTNAENAQENPGHFKDNVGLTLVLAYRDREEICLTFVPIPYAIKIYIVAVVVKEQQAKP